MTAGKCLIALALIMAAGPGAAANLHELYKSDAIVTGTGEENRQIGFRECLDEVLVKVSGDQRVLDAPALAPLMQRAGDFVASFSYRDRLEGIPIHDEQGTYDRPHDLTCRYEPSTVDALLLKLGRKPWLTPRPQLAVFLSVRDQKRSFVLTSDGAESPYMAQSLDAATVPLALSATLPDGGILAAEKLDFAAVTKAEPARLDALARMIGARTIGGNVALAGTLEWSDQARGWIAWRLIAHGKIHRWRLSGVNFDEAFRNAIRGAAQILSGNGAPRR
jgi:uncharacterized protein